MPCIFDLQYSNTTGLWDASLERMDHGYMIGGSGHTPKEAIDRAMESFLLVPGKSLRSDKCNARLQDIETKGDSYPYSRR